MGEIPVLSGKNQICRKWAFSLWEGLNSLCCTPVPALLAGTALAILLIATNSFNSLMAILAFFFVAGYVVSFWSVFVLRRREPQAPR